MKRKTSLCMITSFFLVLFFITLVLCADLVFHQKEAKPSSGMTATTPNTDLTAVAPASKYAAETMTGITGEMTAKVINSSIFSELIGAATMHPRRRKMTDLTKDPESNTMQTLINTWINGSYSPVHRHDDYSEAFVILRGALAFFVFSEDGSEITCHILFRTAGEVTANRPNTNLVMIVEKKQWHAMAAAPPSLGYPGHAVIFETSGHTFDTSKATKILAPFAPQYGSDGLNGDPLYFETVLLPKCPHAT